MMRFTIGVLIAAILGTVAATWIARWLHGDPVHASAFAAWCTLALAIAVCAGALAAHLLLPKRLLASTSCRRGQGWAAICWGLVAGSFAWLWAAVALALLPWQLERPVVESLVVTLCGFAVGVLCIVPLPRVRAGACAGCGYPIADLTPASRGRCPECGIDLFASASQFTPPCEPATIAPRPALAGKSA